MYPGQVHEVSGMACPNYRRRPPVPEGDYRVIPLSNGSYAYVDAADYEWLSQWAWNVVGGGYAARNDNGKTVLMHRQILRPPRGKFVDHKDGNRANNCRSNLRVCTRKENMRNLRKQNGSVSRFKGVTYCKRMDKWFGRCWYEGGDHYLGSFDDEVEAARAYDRRAVEMLGEFARLNFPREWPPERRAEVRAQWAAARKKEARRARKKVKSAKAKGKKGAGAKGKDGKAKRGPRSAAETRGRGPARGLLR